MSDTRIDGRSRDAYPISSSNDDHTQTKVSTTTEAPRTHREAIDLIPASYDSPRTGKGDSDKPWRDSGQRDSRFANQALFARQPEEVNVIAATDVRQQKMNDCYFVAGAGALANTPDGQEQIRKMILPLDGEKSESGRYTGIGCTKVLVAFPNAGRPITQIVDLSAMPKDGLARGKVGVADDGDPSEHVRSVTDDRAEVWPAALEAAYAASRGGYEQIANRGDSLRAMTLFCEPNEEPYATSDSASMASLCSGAHSTPCVADTKSKLSAYAHSLGMLEGHTVIVLGEDRQGKIQVRDQAQNRTISIPKDKLAEVFERVVTKVPSLNIEPRHAAPVRG
jgi:hypothetical protein